MNKNMKAFLALVILVLAIGTVYFIGLQRNKSRTAVSLVTPIATQTAGLVSNDLANWKTYTNTDYSFQIDYPSRFHFVENANLALGDKVAIFSSSSNAHIAIRAIHDIDVYQNKKPEEVAKREIMDSGYKYNVIGVKTGNYSAAITTVENNLKDKYPIITIAHPSKNLFIELEINIPINDFQGESDKILSSFKFLNNVDTSSWKTYTNTKYGYIIKYPNTLTPIETSDDVIYLHHIEFKDPKVTSISGITVEVRNLTSLEDEIVYRKWQVEGHLIPDKIDSEEPVTVSGFSGTILNYTSGEEKFSIAIVPYKKFVYTIMAPSNQLELYNQLLSTFKLTQ